MGKRSGSKKKDKNKVILPPELPEINDDEVVVSDEDVAFFSSDKRRIEHLRKLDKKSIDSYVKRVTGQDEGEVERLYEQRQKRKATALRPSQEDDDLEVDPVDALPIKTLRGELVYNNAKKARTEGNASGVKSKAKDEGVNAKQSIQKDERKGKSKNNKGDGKLQDVQSQTEVPKGKLHSEVLESPTKVSFWSRLRCLMCFLFLYRTLAGDAGHHKKILGLQGVLPFSMPNSFL